MMTFAVIIGTFQAAVMHQVTLISGVLAGVIFRRRRWAFLLGGLIATVVIEVFFARPMQSRFDFPQTTVLELTISFFAGATITLLTQLIVRIFSNREQSA